MTESNTTSIKKIVNDTIEKLKTLKKLKELDNFPYKDQIQQSIIDVIQYKLDGAKEDDLKAKKNMWEDTGYIERGQILKDSPSDETSDKPKSRAMIKNIANTMATPVRGLRRMYRSKNKSANLNDVILNSIKRAKTGECFTVGKHFRTTGTSNLDSHDAKIFTEFCIYATYNLYEALTKELNTDIKKADLDKSSKKTERDNNNKSIQEELIEQVKTDLNDPAKIKIDEIKTKLQQLDDKKKPSELITILNTLKNKLETKTILSPEIYNFLNIILEQIKFLTKQRENIISKIVDNNDAQDDTVIEKNIKKIQKDILNKEQNSIENQILQKEKDFIINLDKIISKIETFNTISNEMKSTREHYEKIKKNIQEVARIMQQHLDKIKEAKEKLISAQEKLNALNSDSNTTDEQKKEAEKQVELAEQELRMAAAAMEAEEVRMVEDARMAEEGGQATGEEEEEEVKEELDEEEGEEEGEKFWKGGGGEGDETEEEGAYDENYDDEEFENDDDGDGGDDEGEGKAEDDRKTIDYEIEKFCNKYFQYFFEFARINIYVIVNCSSILNDLAKALALLIGLQLKKSIGTANQDKLSNDKLANEMKEENLFGSGAFFNMYSLNIIKYIGFIYENSIPEIEKLIGSVNDKYTRLKILDNYLTSKYEKMVLGKESNQKDNEKYEIDNPFIKNLLQDIFPDMGFSDGLIRKNIQNIDRAIEEHSDNIDLLQAELQNFLPIKFEENGLLFANTKIQQIMFQESDKKKLKEIIKEKEKKIEELTRLLAQARVKSSARKELPPASK